MPATCPPITANVCGCDGNTYSNACVAAQAGWSVAYSNTCQQLDGGSGG
jgi:hypothetical protein